MPQRECAETNAALLRLDVDGSGRLGGAGVAAAAAAGQEGAVAGAGPGAGGQVDMGAILGTVILEMRSELEPTRLEAMRWLHFMLARAQELVLQQVC